MFRGKTSLVNPNPPAIEHDLVEPPPIEFHDFPRCSPQKLFGSGISQRSPRLNGPGLFRWFDDVNPLRFRMAVLMDPKMDPKILQ